MKRDRSRTAPLAPWRPSRAALIAIATAVLVIVFIVLFDWNWFKAPIERRVSAETGREFSIGGDLDVDLGRVTTIRASALRFGNAPWSQEAIMASADHAEMDVEVWPLIFQRSTRIPEIRLTKPYLRLETGPDGKGNWVFGKQDGESKMVFRRLWIDDGQLKFLDVARKTDIDVQLDSAPPNKAGGAPPVDVEGRGHWRGSPFTLKGRAESLLELRNEDQPYRIDLRATAGTTRAHARGTLLDPLQLHDFDVDLLLTGQNLEHLYPLIGIAMPPTPPYRLDGRFSREGDTWHYNGFTGEVGDSDLSGSANITVGGERPLLKANLVSKRLDFDDLAGFVGATPQVDEKEAGPREQKAQRAVREKADARVLPQTPYDLGKLRAMDADVRWKATRINAPKLPIDDMDAHLKLDAGVLRLEPLNFGVADGDLRSNIVMDARGQIIRTRAQIDAHQIKLGKLFPDTELTRNTIGRIGGDIAIVGTGNSVAQILGSADGDIALGMGQGRISNLLMELAGIDIAEALKFMVTKDRTIPIRCAFGDFAVKNGVMDAQALAFDSTDTIIIGKGQVNLKDETLDLELRPRPKDRSLLALRSPLVVGGTFKDPSFRPDLKRLGLRGATALALGSIAPPAALLATLELGPGEDAQCGGEYAK